MRKYRIDKATGKATFAIVQAEDEIAAIGMVIGAGWAGARAMTSTSGPGISLMAEFTGLGYYAEVPAVIFDVQRVGPSTGLPTRTAQGDILSTAVLSHGDTRHPLLLPASVGECYSMAIEAFDLAERLQTPVFVMSDLDLGMNNWMSDPFPYPERPIDRGKVLDEADARADRAVGPLQGRGRRRHPVPHAAGDGAAGVLHARLGPQRQGAVQRARRRLRQQHGPAGAASSRPRRRSCRSRRSTRSSGARIGLIAYGTSHWAMVESRDQLRDEGGLETSYLRLRAYPFPDAVAEFIAAHDRVYVVEQNRDAQMLTLLRMDYPPALAEKLRSVLHYNGLPIDARSITDGVLSQEGLAVAGTADHGPAAVGGE